MYPYYDKPKNYPGRWIVRSFEAIIVVAIILVAGSALLDHSSFSGMNNAMPERIYSIQQMSPAPQTDLPNEYHTTALRYQMLDMDQEAINYYNRALELDAQYADTYLNRGVAYETMGDYGQALSDFWQYVNLNSSEVHYHAGIYLNETTTIDMAEGRMVRIPFYPSSDNELIHISAVAADGNWVDPLLIVLDPWGMPVAANDDTNGSTLDSTIWYFDTGSFSAYSDCSNQYTLVISHAGAGSYGSVDVTVETAR